MFASTSALSASSAAISSMMACGVRWAIASPPLGFFTERSKVFWSTDLASDGPGFGGVGEGFLELDEFGEVVVIERIGFAQVAAGIELVVPDFAGWRAFFEKEDNGFDACALKRAAGTVEDGVEVAGFEKQLAQADGGIVRVGEESVFDNDAAAAAGFENFDEVLEEEEGGFAGLMVKFC